VEYYNTKHESAVKLQNPDTTAHQSNRLTYLCQSRELPSPAYQ